MKSVKYILILAGLSVLYFLWQFVSATIESGLPKYPLYYIASVLEIILGYLTYRFAGTQLARRLPFLVALIYILCFGIPIVLYYTKIGILWQVGGSQTWYILSALIFWLVRIIRHRSLKTETVSTVGNVEQLESLSKGLVLFILIMAILFAPLLIFAFLMTLLS